MIVVTGGAGFIGANIVKGLNDSGIDDILVVDNLEKGEKFLNLVDCSIMNFIDKRDFLSCLSDLNMNKDIKAILHQGACSDTMEWDGRYMMENNYHYSRNLFDYCARHNIQFIYASSASVYGTGQEFKEEPECEDALNLYAYSKLLFDRYVRQQKVSIKNQVVGFRYFNVYGPREQHKGKMASVAYHFYNQLRDSGKIKLFEGYDGYENGEQRRDFVWIGDVVDINLYMLENPEISGVFNIGTGSCKSFNDVALAVINAVKGDRMSINQAVSEELIEYIEFPESLKGRYQSFTEADITKLRNVGYDQSMTDIKQGVKQYIDIRISS